MIRQFFGIDHEGRTCILTWLIIGPNRDPRVLSLPNAFSRTVGKDKKRSVCPVGAVSKTITEYSMDLTCLEIQVSVILDAKERRKLTS